jgi:predicted 2-oxoglutarate/Fe(II)-dependent dioxygenase YbiX
VDNKEHESFDSQFQQDLQPLLDGGFAHVRLTMEPRAGRVILFTSGMENTHMVEQVKGGQRFVLSFWFTCDERKEFQIFLDGNAHQTFSHKFRDRMKESQTKTNHNYAKNAKKSAATANKKQEL